MKKVFVKTYGCQMNVYDSERMISAIEPSGYIETKSKEEADLILLNTCHIREKATEKVFAKSFSMTLVLQRLDALSESIRSTNSRNF